ncbi:acetylajmalan esterase-like [Heracleum sosnowskyi]|uniref:Acetylajmalan esterase-like n=1 Tax=Heracleum sosnowskyi TaxID=360622 RepID=A0AAD8ILR6_9APIA|nr:acetylajmalan esterase-like [Heracleum sosnowskyi]
MIFSSSLCRTQVASTSLGSGLPDIRMLRSCQIHSIYQLGDSISDTGNSKVENPLKDCDQLPYGISFLQEPTGRCSDGLLMIDHIASAAGIPLLNPYLKSNANFTNGVNFAVGGSTALSANALAKRNIILPSTNSSLGVQLEWMSTYFASQCNRAIDCSPGSMKHALFMVGEIGGNDYNFALLQGKTVAEAQNMVPEVVEIIIYAIRRVVGFGATRVIVPGNFPIGCFPGFLAPFISNNESSYDKDQCLKEMNKVAEFHNEYLQHAVDRLQEENPTTTIVYADYYNAFKWLLHNAPHLGIDATSILKSCCGKGGKYSFSLTDRCGRPDVPACSNPDEYISWDGVHLTQKAYSVLAQWLVADITPKLNCINLQDQ